MEEKPASGSAEPHDSEPRRTDPEHQHNITPRYTYSRLSSDHASIRLIEVLPGNNESPLQCQLSHHPLDSDLQFYALSYTWDQGGGYQDIGCDGRNLRVTKNLCNFLLQFRETETRQFLWVDAICIDQENFEERSSQVQLMRRIYSDATRVFVWLGNANSTTALAFRLIEDTILDQIDKSIWDENAVVELLSRPYWSRVWIIQEFF
ncbi:HET-domain-containing protein, partial [Amniculicola lignicola CBS 123094]